MTNEEAYAYIKRCNLEDIPKEAFKIALKALELQIPKEPDEENNTYYCPTCNFMVKRYAHHCACGQALNWGL